MKRSYSLRLPVTLLPLLAIVALLSCRASVRQSLPSPSPATSASATGASVPPSQSNSTLLHLASYYPYEAVVRRDVHAILTGDVSAPILGTPAVWRNLATTLRQRTRYNHVLPNLRRSLLNWWRNRRFQPEIMSNLIDLVKRPIDQHAGLPADSDQRYASCAVVGNSGILLNADHGELIDTHDLVIRLNNAQINGYQRNVGSKTNLSFINSNILHQCARKDDGCFCHPYGESVPIIMYICQAAHFLDYTVCNSSHKAPLLITEIRFDMLCSRTVKYYSLKGFAEESGKAVEEWRKFHDEGMFHYSSGMQAVMLALGICDRVSVFGFGKAADAKHHYHTNQKAELGLHDYEAEYAFYRDLVERPQRIPFLQDSGFRVPPIVFYHY